MDKERRIRERAGREETREGETCVGAFIVGGNPAVQQSTAPFIPLASKRSPLSLTFGSTE